MPGDWFMSSACQVSSGRAPGFDRRRHSFHHSEMPPEVSCVSANSLLRRSPELIMRSAAIAGVSDAACSSARHGLDLGSPLLVSGRL